MKYIIYSHDLINYVDQYWIDIINCFQNNDWISICVKNQDEINKYNFLNTDVVFYIIGTAFLSIPSSECYKIFFLCDMHGNSPIILNNIAYADLIVTQNSIATIKKHNYMNNKSYISCGWGIKKVVSLKFNEDPIKKILVSGALNHAYYPLRVYASRQNKNMIDSLNHPGYNKITHKIIGDDYILYLNKYLCCFCDGSILKIVLKKVYEILYSGALLLSDLNIKNELEEIGIIENIHCILCNKENMEEKMKYILDEKNNKIIENIRQNGFKLANESFLLETHYNNLCKNLKTYIKNN